MKRNMRIAEMLERIAEKYRNDIRMKREIRLLQNSDLFDSQWYRQTYLKNESCDPVRHFAKKGWKLGYDPSPWFSTKDYLAYYHDVRDAKINPLIHYEISGKYEFRMIWYKA